MIRTLIKISRKIDAQDSSQKDKVYNFKMLNRTDINLLHILGIALCYAVNCQNIWSHFNSYMSPIK